MAPIENRSLPLILSAFDLRREERMPNEMSRSTPSIMSGQLSPATVNKMVLIHGETESRKLVDSAIYNHYATTISSLSEKSSNKNYYYHPTLPEIRTCSPSDQGTRHTPTSILRARLYQCKLRARRRLAPLQ